MQTSPRPTLIPAPDSPAQLWDASARYIAPACLAMSGLKADAHTLIALPSVTSPALAHDAAKAIKRIMKRRRAALSDPAELALSATLSALRSESPRAHTYDAVRWAAMCCHLVARVTALTVLEGSDEAVPHHRYAVTFARQFDALLADLKEVSHAQRQ